MSRRVVRCSCGTGLLERQFNGRDVGLDGLVQQAFCVAPSCSLRALDFQPLSTAISFVSWSGAPRSTRVRNPSKHLAVGVRDLRQALRNLGVLSGDDLIMFVNLLQKALRQSLKLHLAKTLKAITSEHEPQCAELACALPSANAAIAGACLHQADHTALAQALPWKVQHQGGRVARASWPSLWR